MSDARPGEEYLGDDPAKAGGDACPFNLLYWHFLDRHRSRFEGNPRMAMLYRGWDKRGTDERRAILDGAEAWLRRLEAGATV